MAVRSKDELLNLIKERVGDDASDEAINFIEDVSDTLNDYEDRISGQEDYKRMYEENDAEWREKYKERFFSGDPTPTPPDPEPDVEPPKKVMSYEDLFTIKE